MRQQCRLLLLVKVMAWCRASTDLLESKSTFNSRNVDNIVTILYTGRQCWKTGATFLKLLDWVFKCLFSLKFYRLLAVMVAKPQMSKWLRFSKYQSFDLDTWLDETPVTFQSRWSILNANIATWRLSKTFRLNVSLDIETTESVMNSALNVVKKSIYSVL